MPSAPFTFPDPVGTVRLRFRNDDLEWIEEEFEEDLDALNDRIIDGKGPQGPDGKRIEQTFASVWDAIEPLLERRLFRGMRRLVVAGIAHGFDGGDPATQRDRAAQAVQALPPSVYRDEDLAETINIALGEAFGVKPAGLPKSGDEEVEADPPPQAAEAAL